MISQHPVSDADPFCEAFARDPFSIFATLRDAGPAVRLERYGVWGLARYAEVFAALKDWETFCSSSGVGLSDFSKEKPYRPPSIVLEVDPPLHTRTHRVLARVMSPAALRHMRAAFERDAQALVDALLEKREFDAIADVARAYPLKVFPDAVGLPSGGREALLTYGNMVFNFLGPRNALFEEALASAPQATKAVMALCERDALAPEGIGAAIFDAHDSGEVTYQEAGMLVRSLLSAGLDTTINALGCALVCLARFPDQWSRLREDPSLARNAFDETIRYESPVQTFFRTTTREVTVGDVKFGAGEKVVLFFGSANRDPRQWERPDEFDVSRRTGAHVGFGAGIHRCVGEMLSKLEGEILLAALARRVKTISLRGEPEIRFNNTLRGYERAPLSLEPA